MPFDFGYHVLMPLTLGTVSLAFIALGLYGLVRRRPFIINARWMLVIIIVAWSPQFALPLSWFFTENQNIGDRLGVLSWISLLTMIVVIGYIALQMRGYMVFGTTQESFREALLAALSKLNLKSEETLSSIRLPSVPAELQVAVYGWVGTGQLRLRNGGRPRLLADVARGMTDYFDSAQVKMNMTTVLAYVILGALMIAMLIALRVTVWP